MKHFFYSAVIALMAVALTTACNSGGDTEYHALRVNSQASNNLPVIYYADQQADSLEIVSTDSWKSNTACEWIKFKKTMLPSFSQIVNYVYGNEVMSTEAIIIEPNTTGKNRNTIIQFDANNRTVGLAVSQMGHINIIDPMLSQTPDQGFIKTIDAKATSTTTTFNTYAPARLQTTTEWISVPDEQFETGRHTATITIQPNTTGIERTAIVTLVSTTGAKTDIIIMQQK